MTDSSVKQCPGCGARLSLKQIRECDEIRPLGMQVIGPGIRGSVYYFSHIRPGCGTTFVVSVLEFLPFIEETMPTDILTDTHRCEGHCLTLADLGECGQACLYAPFRRLLISMLKRSESESRPVVSAVTQSPSRA